MKGLFRSYKIVENQTIRGIDARRTSLNRSARKLAKRDRKRSEERDACFAELSRKGVLRIPR